MIHDLNSRNGTMVNGTVTTRQQLHPNDIVSFGSRSFRIECVAAEPQRPAPAAAPYDPEGATIGGMAAIGPLIGGYVTSYLSWRYAFYINIPFGAFAFAESWKAKRWELQAT